MPELSQILISLISMIIFIPINALILWPVTKMFKLQKSNFLTALKTAAAAAVILFVIQQLLGLVTGAVTTPTAGLGTLIGMVGLVFLITIVLTILVNSYAIKKFYKQETKKAFLVGIVWSVLTWAISLIISAIIVGIVVAIILGTGAAAGY